MTDETILLTDQTEARKPAQSRECLRCKGTGKAYKWRHETEAKPCYSCRGSGAYAEPDFTAIVAAIKGRKGLVSKRPTDRRAYYVWRMARFHGGRDVTLPMGASMEIEGDPWVQELDLLAEAVAKRAFGTDMAAAHRWGMAFGYLQPKDEMPGLPVTAYPSGPVLADDHKPAEERYELDLADAPEFEPDPDLETEESAS